MNTDPGPDQRRVTLTLDLDDDGLVHVHAADALLHLISWLEHDNIRADATLHIHGQGILRATSRRPS